MGVAAQGREGAGSFAGSKPLSMGHVAPIWVIAGCLDISLALCEIQCGPNWRFDAAKASWPACPKQVRIRLPMFPVVYHIC